MLHYPRIDPVLFHVGPLALRWYGLMYAIGFLFLAWVMRQQQRAGFLRLSESDIDRLFFWLVAGLIVGARVFYAAFYSAGGFLSNPLEIFALWHGGMSFHGGLAGVVCACWFFCRRKGIPFFSVTDTLVLSAPVGLGFGRIGNFINGELFGRVTTLPWGMIFPQGGPLPRHPSQIYEAFLEGVLLGVILWLLRGRVRKYGILSGVFLVGYGVARITVEFFREPDVQLGFVAGPFTMGQLLSAAVLIPGILILVRSMRSGAPVAKSVH